jgi:hypothetical protein
MRLALRAGWCRARCNRGVPGRVRPRGRRCSTSHLQPRTWVALMAHARRDIPHARRQMPHERGGSAAMRRSRQTRRTSRAASPVRPTSVRRALRPRPCNGCAAGRFSVSWASAGACRRSLEGPHAPSRVASRARRGRSDTGASWPTTFHPAKADPLARAGESAAAEAGAGKRRCHRDDAGCDSRGLRGLAHVHVRRIRDVSRRPHSIGVALCHAGSSAPGRGPARFAAMASQRCHARRHGTPPDRTPRVRNGSNGARSYKHFTWAVRGCRSVHREARARTWPGPPRSAPKAARAAMCRPEEQCESGTR